MRKASHDGGDSTSITSGVENETKKSAMKPKKSSLKRKVANFSQESDDTVIEPLLQKDKEKSEPQSAKYFGKGKTDSLQNDESNSKAKTTSTTGFCGTTESLLSFKDPESNNTTSGVVAPLHNYMNTNVFNTHDNAKANVTTKSQILVEIDSSKQSSYTPGPLIFTTAKIHTDAKTKQMEPVPISSTIEVSVSKKGSITNNEKKISNGSSVINPVYSPMPLSKGKEEKVTVSSFSTIISPTINKDPFGRPVTSTTKLANITTAQSSSMKITLPSTTSNSLLMKSNTNYKKEDIKDVKKEQTLPHNVQLQSKAFNLDSTKNNVMVKTILPSPGGKAIDISTTSAQTSQDNKPQVEKLETCAKTSVNVTSYDSLHFTSSIKTPTCKNSVELSNPVKSFPSSVGNKQLQRQKTTTEEISHINMEQSENSSAKIPSSTHPKVIDSISIKNIKLPNVSANNMQIMNSKSSTNNTADSISITSANSTTIKPKVVTTSVASSNIVRTSADVSSKPLTTTNTGKTVSPTTATTKALSNGNKITTPTGSSTGITKLPADDVTKTSIPTSIVTSKCPEETSMQTQPHTSISKTLPEKTPVVDVSTAKTTTSLSSDKNKAASMTTVKPPSALPKTTATTLTQPIVSTNKTTVTKIPSVTTSVKTASVSSVTGTATKPSSSSSQVARPKPNVTAGSVDVVKASTVTTLIPKTLSGTVGSITTTSQSITSTPGNVNKQAITTIDMTATTKTPSVVTSKSSKVKSSVPASITAGVKSPNNISSQMFDASKSSTTSIPKTESVTTLSKTSAETSSANVNTVKSPQGTSAATKNTKDSAASVKKPAVTKIQSITTKSPTVSSANKSIVEPTTKVSSSEVPTSATKKPGGSVSTKTVLTTSTKTPSVSTLTKTPDVASSSCTTTSASAIKPTTPSATQVSANKSVGIAESSVASTTPVLKPPESVKKAGSKTIENNKNGKLSNA